MQGGEKFTKLDLKCAYNQIVLDEESRQILTLNTHKGLFRPTRLTYGVNFACGTYQRNIEQVLKGCPMIVVRVDDIIVTGKDDQEHLKNLDMVCRGWQMPV